MGLIYPYQRTNLAKIEIKKYLRGSLLLYRGVTIFQLYAKKDKKRKILCPFCCVRGRKRDIVYLYSAVFSRAAGGELYLLPREWEYGRGEMPWGQATTIEPIPAIWYNTHTERL